MLTRYIGFCAVLPSDGFGIESNRRMGEGAFRPRLGSYARKVSLTLSSIPSVPASSRPRRDTDSV